MHWLQRANAEHSDDGSGVGTGVGLCRGAVFLFGFGVMRLQVDDDVVVVVDSLHWSRFRSLQQTKNQVLQRKLVND
jgi:hypothetical protein